MTCSKIYKLVSNRLRTKIARSKYFFLNLHLEQPNSQEWPMAKTIIVLQLHNLVIPQKYIHVIIGLAIDCIYPFLTCAHGEKTRNESEPGCCAFCVNKILCVNKAVG